MTNEHVIETRSQIYAVKRQMSTEMFNKATGNKCKEFYRNQAHNEVI